MTVVLSDRHSYGTSEVITGGVRIRFAANSESVLDVVKPQQSSSPRASVRNSLEVNITVSDELQETSSRPHFRGRNHIVYMSFGGSSFVIDLLRRKAHCMITKRFAADRNAWHRQIIPILLGVLGPTVGVVPVHSACLIWKHGGVLLVGESGAGKSTLAVALAKCGMKLISDDWTYITASKGKLLCHGVRAPVKLLADASRHFPELQRLQPEIAMNGELAYEVSASEVLGIETQLTCTPTLIIVVDRQKAPGSLRSVRSHDIRAYFSLNAERLPKGLAALEATRERVISRMSALSAWRFSYEGPPQDGAKKLISYLERV